MTTSNDIRNALSIVTHHLGHAYSQASANGDGDVIREINAAMEVLGRMAGAHDELLGACTATFPLLQEWVTPGEPNEAVHPDVMNAYHLTLKAIVKATGTPPEGIEEA